LSIHGESPVYKNAGESPIDARRITDSKYFRRSVRASWYSPATVKNLGIMLPNNSVLLPIDLQRAVDDPSWGPRNNKHAEANVARLLKAWRERRKPLIHVRHDSTEPQSTFRPGQIGNEFKPESKPLPGETVFIKKTNSAFIGTDLEAWLREKNYSTLIVAGVSTSNSVEATVRMAGNLGFKTYLVEDAAFTFDKKDWSGRLRTAQEVHDMSLANLDREYCTVTTTDSILKMLEQS
jgi:nicotinamidase-related amidase